jgi:glycosyltransferase involved in cell wall biosynthesis
MLDLALVTDIPFWVAGSGQNARIHALYSFLAIHSKLTLYYLGKSHCPFTSYHFHTQDKDSELAEQLRKGKHNRIIVETIYLDWITELGLTDTLIYLDAHDIVSDRIKAFQRFNRECGILSFEEEIKRLSKFDKVFFLQKEEVEKIIPHLGKERVLLCPHPVVPQNTISIRKQVKTIGFFGGSAIPNIDGIQWFYDAVIPLLGDLGEKCIVHGAINYFLPPSFPRFARGHLLPSIESYYQDIDIAINPVLYGSGLKIKTVEALAYGIPLVTTSVGVQGLKEESNRSFLVADTPQEFAASLIKLASSFSLRSELSLSSKAFAERNFTPEACFNTLLN